MHAKTLVDLESEVHGALASAENLLEQAADATGDKAAALRASAMAKLHAAREKLGESVGKAVERSKEAAKATDAYVHEHPWRVIGGVLAVGVLVGLLINRKQ